MSKAKNTDGAGRVPFKVIAALCAVAMGAATAAVTTSAASAAPATVQTTQSASVQTAADQSNEELEIASSGLPSKTAPFDQTIAYFLWPYQWGTQNVGDTKSPKQSALQVDRGSTSDVNQTESASGNAADEPQTYSQGDLSAGEYGWKGPGTRPTEPNLKSLDAQLKLVKESGMTYVKTSYLISPLNAADPNCDQSKPGDCSPSTDLPDQIIQHILDAGLKPVVYFSQGNPDPKAVSNPDPNQVYKTVPSFTKQQVKDTIAHAIQKFANKGIIWEAFNEPDSEEHWPGGNNAEEAKIQWIELDQFIGDTIQKYDPDAAYVWGNLSKPDNLKKYQNEMKAAGATAVSSHGYWISSPEGPLASSPVGGYDFMDSEFGCSAANTETSWSCGFSGVPKDSNLQGIWLIRQLLVKDIKGLNLASPYRMVGYDSFSINSDNDPANPGDVKTTEAYSIIKDVTLALKGYSYVDGSYQNADGVYRAIYRNKSGAQKLVYWTADKPTLDNDDQTKDVTINFENQDVKLTAKAVPQVYETPKAPQEGTYLTNLTAWKTTDGQVIQAHGGSVLKDGDTFYWVGQGAPDNVPTGYNGANGVFANQWLYTTINMYKSKDLVNWQFANAVTSIDDPNAAEYCDGNVAGLTSKVLNYNDNNEKFKKLVEKHPQYLQNSKLGCKIERPHILKNAKTGKYLIWAHWEGTVGYGSSQLIAFQSDTVDGKYQPLKWQDGQVHAQPKVNVNGKLTPMASRDLSAWADPDTGKAYIVSSTEKVRLYRLNDDYTGVDPDGSYQFPNISYREAPSLFKENGRFYMITSAQDYWDPTQTEYASTSNIEDPNGWTNLTELQSRDEARKNWGNQDSNTRTYIGQPTYVLQYQDANNKPAVMLLADDWNPLHSKTANVDTTKANYVMTPVKRLGNNQLSTPFQRTVVPMGAGQAPSTIVAVENPDAVTTAMGVAPVLPTTVKATWSDKTTTDEPVTWDAIPAESYAKPGSFEVKGKAAGLDVTVKVTVENAPVSVEKLADVTTNVGNVAQLPKTAKVTWADGTTTEEAVDWSSVDSQKFFTIGTFTATGKVKGLDTQVTVNVTLKDGTYVIATAIEDGSRVVDMTGASKAAGARAQLYTANGTMAQRYKFKHLDNGNYTIKNVNSGLFLAHGSAAGDPVTQQKDSNKSDTQWTLTGTDSALTITAADTQNLVLDLQGANNADGTPVQIYTSNGSVAQQWKISGAETPRDRLDKLADEHRNDIADGTYKFAAGKKNAEVLDVAGGSRDNGANVQIYSGNGTDAQAWTIKHDADGYLTITNAGSGKVLDVAGGSTDPGANVQQYDGNGTWAQKWIAVSTANGFKIQSAAAENLVLDIVGGSTDDGTNVQIYSSNDSSAQRWRLKKTTTTRQRLDKLAADHKGDLADGTYEIASTAAKQMRFDVVGGSADDGANVQLYESNGTNAQAWKVSHDKTGYVTLTNAKSGKVLDISGASTGDGANVQQWSSNGSLAQKWVLVKESNGSFTLHSALREDFVIDAAAGGTSNGTNIQMWTSNNSVAQHWAFNKK